MGSLPACILLIPSSCASVFAQVTCATCLHPFCDGFLCFRHWTQKILPDCMKLYCASIRNVRTQHDQIVFHKFKARCRGNQTDQESSGDDSPGEFEPRVRLVLENMVQVFEMQTTRLRIEQLREAFQKLTKKSKRPTFKRSLQFSSEAISID